MEKYSGYYYLRLNNFNPTNNSFINILSFLFMPPKYAKIGYTIKVITILNNKYINGLQIKYPKDIKIPNNKIQIRKHGHNVPFT